MENPFAINIDCSKILNCKEGTQYTMLIDKSKMTIVFEFVEWIRWIFSADDCFYLAHNNSVIHELEDISILSQLKTFEIKPCGQLQCIHKKIYRKLLSNIKIFVQWNNLWVPRYFFDKVTDIEQKIMLQRPSFSGNKENNTKTCLTQTPQNLKNCEFLEEKTVNHSSLFKETICGDLQRPITENNPNRLTKSCQVENQYPANYRIAENCNKNSNFNAEHNEKNTFKKAVEITECGPTKYCAKNSENNNLRKNISLLQEDTESNLPNNLKFSFTEDENKLNENLKFKNPNGLNKSKRYIKPFSIGELVTNIREKSKEKNCIYREDTGKQITDTQKTLNPDVVDKIPSSEKRKRKRTRSRGNKKKLFVQEIFEASPSIENEKIAFTTNIKNCFDEIKPNHIRFNIDDSDGDADDKNFVDNEYEQKNKNSNCLLIKSDSLKMLKINKEMNDLVSDNTQLFSPINGQNVDVKLTSENLGKPLITNDKFENEENLCFANQTILKPTAPESVSLESNNEDLNTLMLLKEKFPSPVVVERFY